MPLLRRCLLALLILAAGPALAAGDSNWFYRGSDIQPDRAWVFGTLPNGLRYAVRRNALPAGQVSIRLRMDVGSLMETDQQRGWAHFIEHMVFRGTAVSGDEEAREIWERLGASFGSDTNAFTQPTQTFFQLDLPRADRDALDTSLKLLDGMVETATFDPAKVELERGVVLSEYGRRTQLNVELGDLTRSLFYAGLDFAHRDPIGTEATIEAATPAGLKAFYQRWYRPERATLVMVGDADPAMMEKLIAEHFGGWRGIGPAPAEPDYGHVVGVKDPTALLAYPGAPHLATIAWVRPYKPMPHTIATEETDLARSIARQILNRRLEAKARTGADYISATLSAGRSNHIADYTELEVTARDGHWQQALDQAFAILADARAAPPSEAEIAREIKNVRSVAVANLRAEPTIHSPLWANRLVEAVNDDSVTTGTRQSLFLFNALAPRMTPAAVEEAMRRLFEGAAPRMVLLAPQPVTGLHEALAAAEHVPPAARPADRAVSLADLPGLGTAGREVSRQHIDDLGVTIVRFENGSTLVFKQTDYEKGSVSVQLRFGTGVSGLPANRPSLSWMSPVVASTGVGSLDLDGLERLMTGRRLSVGFGYDDDAWILRGTTDGPQLGDELHLLAAKLVAPHWDPALVERVKASALENYDLGFASATARASREFPQFAHRGDARWAPEDKDQIARLTPDDFRRFFEPVLADGPIEAIVVGDTSLDNAVAAMLKTVAALPPRPPVSAPPASLAVQPPRPNPSPAKFTHAGDPGQAFAMLGWSTFGGPDGIRERRALSLAANMVRERLVEQLRDADGVTYTPAAGTNSSQDFPAWGIFYAGAEVKPDRTDLFFRTARAIVADMAARPAGADEFARAINPVLSGLERVQHTNAYWVGALAEWSRRPERIEQTRTQLSDYRSMTPEEVRKDVAAYVTRAPDWSMLVLPPKPGAAAAAAPPRPDFLRGKMALKRLPVSTNAIQAASPPRRHHEGKAWKPFSLRQQPFFTDKNRAFWILQSTGWAGYFVLRTLSGIANAMPWSYVLHTGLLTATGYSITLLIAAIYRRLIRMRPLVTWLVSIAIVLLASAIFSAIETWSHAIFLQSWHQARRRPVSRFDPADLLAARRLVGALLFDQLLSAARGAERPASASGASGERRPTRHAALPAQPPLPFQHAELHLHARAPEADRAGECDAEPALLLPPLYLGQRADRSGDAGAGGGDAEALSRHREDALRGAAAPTLRHRSRRRQIAAALAPAAAVGRECDQICGDAAGGRGGHRYRGAASGRPGGDHGRRHRAGVGRPLGEGAGSFDRRRSGEHPGPSGASLWRRPTFRD